MISKNERYLYWLMGVGCGVLLTGAFITYVGLSVQDEVRGSVLTTDTTIQEQQIDPLSQPLTQEEQLESENNTASTSSGSVGESNQLEENQMEQEMLQLTEQNNTIENNEDILVTETKQNEGPRQIVVEIPSNGTATSISNLLEELGVVDSAEDFRVYIGEQNKTTLLRTGKMIFLEGDSFEEVLNTLLGKIR